MVFSAESNRVGRMGRRRWCAAAACLSALAWPGGCAPRTEPPGDYVQPVSALQHKAYPEAATGRFVLLVHVSGMAAHTRDMQSRPEVCLLVTNSDGGGWPLMIYDEATDDYIDWNIESAVAPHLLDGQWCVIQEVGAEKLRYLVGYATAFNNKGEVITISIDDIFAKLPEGVSTCCY